MRTLLICLIGMAALSIAASAQSSTIVAQVTLKDQTAAIPRTTLVTPAADGLFRITAYFNLPNTDALGTRWCLFFYWGDDVDQRSYGPLGIDAPGDSGPTFGSATVPVQAQAGRPIKYQTGPCPGGTKNDPYNLFITLEQLQ